MNKKILIWGGIGVATAALIIGLIIKQIGSFFPVIDATVENPATQTSYKLLQEQLRQVLGTLPPREQEVLKMRFGLDDGYSLTLEEVGLYFNVTRERIRQIEAKALRRLRHPRRANGLRDYIET